MFTSEDIDAILSDEGFSSPATYTPQGGQAKIINGDFRNDFQMAQVLGIDIESASPAFECKLTDISGVRHNDTLVISGVTYYIQGIQPDATTGFTLLILSRDQV